MWWPWLLAFGCFLLTRPYEGFVHDARLYIGFAIAPLDPTGIGTDLLFQGDGQAGLSLYPQLLRGLIRLSTPSQAALAITLLSLVLWFGGAWRLIRRLWPDLSTPAVGGVLLVATSIHTYYGGSSTFRAAEAFASPRVLAEGLVLWAVAAVIQRSWFWGIALLGGALLVHPLMAVVGVAVAGWLIVPSLSARVLLSVGIAAGGALVLLVSAMMGQRGGVLALFDAGWLAALDRSGALVFLANWDAFDWARIVVHAVTVGMAVGILAPLPRRLAIGVLLTACGGVMFSYAGADLVHHVLLTQAQPWRALWLLAVLAGLLLGWLVYEMLQVRARATSGSYTSADGYRQVAVCVLVIAWAMLSASPSSATLAMLAGLLWLVPIVRPTMTLPNGLARGTLWSVPPLLLLLAIPEAQVVWQVYSASPEQEMLWQWSTVVLAGGMRVVGVTVALFMLGASVAANRGSSHGYPLLRAMVVAGALGAAFLLFDSRSPFERTLEAQLDDRVRGIAPAVKVPAGPVFWPDGEVESWAFLGQPGYASIIQGTPRVFSRTLAIQWAERRRLVSSLQSVTRAPRYRLRLDRLYADSPEGIRTLCGAADAPATVALWRPPPWTVKVETLGLRTPQLLPGQDPGEPWEARRTLFLVACSDVRSMSAR